MAGSNVFENKLSTVQPGVYVGKGAKIKNSIIMQNSEVYNNSDLEYVILDKSVNIRQGRRLIGDEVFPVIIRKGAIV